MLKALAFASRPFRALGFARSIIDSLESRRLLSVSLNSGGWTVVTPPAGAHVIYCSSSTGNDNNNGLSPSDPVKTLAHGESLLANGTGDQLLLEAGNVFYGNFIFWTKSGASAQDPMVLGSYGNGARPEIMTGTQDGLETGSVGAPVVNYLDILGINFCANGRDPALTSSPDTTANPSAIEILTKSNGILVENCEFQYYDVDLTFQDYLGPVDNVTVRRNTIIDAYSGNTHAQGLYATGVTNLTIDDNLFDQNGYNTQLGIPPTVFNQDCYLAYNDVNCVVTNNVFSRASDTGLEDRPGGIVENNTFIDDPVGMTFGLVNGALTTAGGVSGTVSGNVFIGGGDIGNFPEGQGLQVGNIKASTGATISNNLFTQGGANASPAITVCAGKSQIDPQDSVGVNNLTITGNIFNQWSTGIDVVSGLVPGGSGLYALNHLTITNNEFESLTSASIENHSASYASQETISGNSYYDADEWLIDDAPEAAKGAVLTKAFAFPGPSDSVATYDKSLGNSGSVADFLTKASQFSAANWNTAYTADALVAYFEKAFGMKATTTVTPSSSTTTTTTTTVTPPDPSTSSTPTSRSATTAISAASYNAKSGSIAAASNGAIGTNGGAWVEYSQVNFGTGVNNFTASVAVLAKYAGSIELRLDSPTGTLIGTLKIASTGSYSTFVNQTATVSGATGVHNLYLVFSGGGGTGNIASFSFTAAATTTTTTSATTAVSGASYSAKSGNIVAGSNGSIGTNGGAWVEYSQVNFGTGVNKFTASVAAPAKYAGSIELRLDSPTGTLIGTLKIAGTASYSTFVNQTTTVSGATGVHNLYLVFTGGGGTGNIASFSFTAAATTTTSTTKAAAAAIEAASYNAKSGSIATGTNGTIGTNGGAWVEYTDVNFGMDVSKFTASIAALAKYAGSIQLRLDSPTGTLIGTLKIAGTGSYSTYVAQTTAVSGASGVHNLYLVFTGEDGTGNVASFSFS